MSDSRVAITGGSWITAKGYGRLRAGDVTALTPGKVAIPARRSIFGCASAPARYGRFDDYTKLGFCAISLALDDAGLGQTTEERSIGIVSSSRWDSASVDRDYYRTAMAEGGALASPNLFSYTLPGIVHGECAIHYRLTGPTLCVGEGDQRGMTALQTALRMMEDGATSAMISGWIDVPPETEKDAVSGAVFVVMEDDPDSTREPVRWVRCARGEVRLDDGDALTSILDLFEGSPTEEAAHTQGCEGRAYT